MASNVVYLDDWRQPHSLDSERTARLWEAMDANVDHWEALAHGCSHEARLNVHGDMDEVYAYCAHALRILKRAAVEAIYLEKLSDSEVLKRIVIGLGLLQAECTTALQDRSLRRDVYCALVDVASTFSNMRLAAGWNGAQP